MAKDKIPTGSLERLAQLVFSEEIGFPIDLPKEQENELVVRVQELRRRQFVTLIAVQIARRIRAEDERKGS